MNLCVCSERRKRCGCAFAYSSAIATFAGLLPFGLQQNRRLIGKERQVFFGHALVDDQFRFVRPTRHARIDALLRRDAEPDVGGQLGEDRSVRFDVDAAAVAAQGIDQAPASRLARAARRRSERPSGSRRRLREPSRRRRRRSRRTSSSNPCRRNRRRDCSRPGARRPPAFRSTCLRLEWCRRSRSAAAFISRILRRSCGS